MHNATIPFLEPRLQLIIQLLGLLDEFDLSPQLLLLLLSPGPHVGIVSLHDLLLDLLFLLLLVLLVLLHFFLILFDMLLHLALPQGFVMLVLLELAFAFFAAFVGLLLVLFHGLQLELLNSLARLLVLLDQGLYLLLSFQFSLFSKLRIALPASHLVINPRQLIRWLELEPVRVVVEARAHRLLCLGDRLGFALVEGRVVLLENVDHLVLQLLLAVVVVEVMRQFVKNLLRFHTWDRERDRLIVDSRVIGSVDRAALARLMEERDAA